MSWQDSFLDELQKIAQIGPPVRGAKGSRPFGSPAKMSRPTPAKALTPGSGRAVLGPTWSVRKLRKFKGPTWGMFKHPAFRPRRPTRRRR